MENAHTALSRVPMLRVIIPFVLGILVGNQWPGSWWLAFITIALSLVGYILLLIHAKRPEERLRLNPFFTVPLIMGAVALGWCAALIHCPPQLSAERMCGRVVSGRITQLEYTDFSTRMTVDLLNPDMPSCKVMLTTRGCDYTMNPGDVIAWELDLDEIGNMGNPHEMDYASYMLRIKGIRYQQHLPVSGIHKMRVSNTVFSRLANTRLELSNMVFNSQLSVAAQHLVVALLLGDSGVVDRSTRQAFSSAGIAHILALSGLHVGIVALIIWWLLFPLDYVRLRWLRLVVTMVFVSLFAAFTGMSPSVLRSTIMIGVAFTALTFHRRSSPINSLCIAALIILTFDPSALYGVGFQLSFITVAAILLFRDVPSLFKTNINIVDRLVSMAFISLVAMIATIALTAHYFHSLSFASVLTNLLILPVLPVFMILGVLFLVVTAGGMIWPLLNTCANSITDYINGCATMVNSIPLLHVNGVYVSTMGVIIYFAIVLFLVIWLYRRQYTYLLAAGFSLALLLAHSFYIDAQTPDRGLIIFNSFNSTPVFYYDHGDGYLWTPDDADTDVQSFMSFYSGFLARCGIQDITVVDNDSTMRLNHAYFRPPFSHLQGLRLMAVGNSRLLKHHTSTRMRLDAVVVTKRFHGSITQLREQYDFNEVILSGAMQSASLSQLQTQCDSLGIACHALARDGSWPSSRWVMPIMAVEDQ